MKAIVNIPNEEFKIDTPIKELLQHATSCAVIPDDATNGDVIKAMFDDPAPKYFNLYYLDWWNAPYRGQQDD